MWHLLSINMEHDTVAIGDIEYQILTRTPVMQMNSQVSTRYVNIPSTAAAASVTSPGTDAGDIALWTALLPRSTLLFGLFRYTGFLKCHRLQENTVSPLPVYGTKRSPPQNCRIARRSTQPPRSSISIKR